MQNYWWILALALGVGPWGLVLGTPLVKSKGGLGMVSGGVGPAAVVGRWVF